ncbi:beta-propeller domain-containing protein [Pseudomonadales bacterium]|nr:beta-propeller domain-containing protein [Pseudomonadales bacterium]
MKFEHLIISLLTATLLGCAEGGTGGTGAVITPLPTSNTISGNASKGPLRNGSTVRVSRLNTDGSVASTLTQASITSDAGEFTFDIDDGESNVIIETTGQYFSEVRGDIEDDITLSSIVEINGNNELHNTNLLTTLTSLRIQALMNDGMAIQTAISTAESELLAALSPLLPTLNSPSRFAGSLLISRRQQNSDLDSNAYLLALSSVFDQLAQSRALANNDSAAANMGLLIESVANDLAINGELTNSAVMNELINAMTELNPDQVLLNLFLLDSELDSVANASDLSACEVLLGELTCADDSDQNQNITSVIANLNKFLDSDRDGTVNSLDTDDDNDGILDIEDTRPYSERSLVPVGSAAVFESYIKNGLSEWAGVQSTTAVSMLNAPLASDAIAVSSPESFSEINVQVAGVDEADLTRFDGRYFYTARDNKVSVLAADNNAPSTSLINTIILGDSASISGLYLVADDASDKRLAMLANDYQYQWRPDEVVPWHWTNGTTTLSLYDVEQPESASEITTVNIEGYLVDSRRIGNLLYLITRSTPTLEGFIPYPATSEDRASNQQAINNADINDLLPQYIDGAGATNNLVSAQNCLVPNAESSSLRSPSIVTISAINLQDASDINSVCMAESVFATYVSLDSMYLVSNQYPISRQIDFFAGFEIIDIHKFTFTDLGPVYAGSGRLNGGFSSGNPAYRMGEHNGRLAVITSETFNSGHKITLLEQGENFSLVEVGHLPNAEKPAAIGKEGEMIYSTRIIGDRAYIVTFLTTDPVYVIDLLNLEILGELEIPGYSSYLHPISDDLLLGIGKSAIVEDGVAYFQGMKIQLFDISDPAVPVSASEVEIGFRGTDSVLSYDPHAFTYLPDPETGLDKFALPIDVHGTEEDPEATASTFYPFDRTGLYLFELDTNDATITSKGAITHQLETCSVTGDRGFLADDAVHFFSKGKVLSAPWASPNQVSTLTLSADEGDCYFF